MLSNPNSNLNPNPIGSELEAREADYQGAAADCRHCADANGRQWQLEAVHVCREFEGLETLA